MFSTYLQLTKRYQGSKIFLPILVILMLLNVVFESLSVAAFYPFLVSILGDYSTFSNKFPEISNLISFFSGIFFYDLNESKSFILGSLIIILFIFIIKFLFFLAFNIFQYYFIYDLKKTFSSMMFERYIKYDYYNILIKGSAELQKDFMALIDYATVAILSLINLIVEILILVFIILILLKINFLYTFIIFSTMAIFSTLIYMIFKSRYLIWGKNRETYISKKIDTILDSFNAIKEVKIFSIEKINLKRFVKVNNDAENLNRDLNLVQVIPRGALELFAVMLIVLAIIFLTIKFPLNVLNNYIALISISVLALIRMFPSFNKIIVGFQQIRVNFPSSSKLLSIFKSNEINKNVLLNNQEIDFNDKITLNKIFLNFGNKKILNNINLEIKKNSCIGIKGESGSGKSTLLNVLLGLLEPDEGHILIDKKKINLNHSNWWKKIGFVHQDSHIFNQSIIKNIVINEDQLDEFELNKVLQNCELKKLKNKLDNDNFNLGERGSKISGGEKQRVFLARALYKKPKILILDEPTSSLDNENEQKIINTLKMYKNKMTMIIVSHTQKILTICDKIYEIRDGEIK